jgi:hypothetical protein
VAAPRAEEMKMWLMSDVESAAFVAVVVVMVALAVS